MRVIAFGAGFSGRNFMENMERDTEIVAFADNNPAGKTMGEYPIISPNEIPDYHYDFIIITLASAVSEKQPYGLTARVLNDARINKIKSVHRQLLEIGIPENKIVLMNENHALNLLDPRTTFVRNLADLQRNNGILGAVAECGVARGDFSRHINKYYYDRVCYLFDSFEGMRQSDIANIEDHYGYIDVFKKYGNEYVAYMKCLYKQNVIMKKGFVPETFQGLEDEYFAFVNLDMDVYTPQLEGLKFFMPRMVNGGVILVHDCIRDKEYEYRYGLDYERMQTYEFTKQNLAAIAELRKEYIFTAMPIGDGSSLALSNFKRRNPDE